MIPLPLVFQPAIDMAPGRIVVGPVDNAALRVVFVYTVKRYLVALFQTRQARGEVDVVRHQHGVLRIQL